MSTSRHIYATMLALLLFAVSCIGPAGEATVETSSKLQTTLGPWRLVERDSQYRHTNTTMGRSRLVIKDDSLHFEAYEDNPGPSAFTTHVIIPVSEVEDGPYGWAWVNERTYSGMNVSCRLQATMMAEDSIEVCYQEIYKDPTLDDIADQPEMFYWCYWMVRE